MFTISQSLCRLPKSAAKIDGAIIATPPNIHFEIAKKCLENNLHILVEKPMVSSVEDLDKLNVKGSSLAAGHPFAATGGRLLGVAAKLLNEKGSGRALLSVCAAGGQGVTAILEL